MPNYEARVGQSLMSTSEGHAADGVTLRRCFREPTREIFAAAAILRAAVNAHAAGQRAEAHELIVQANDPAVRAWVAPFLGTWTRNPFLGLRVGSADAALLPKELREPVRMPRKDERAELIRRQGFCCAFCRMPLVRREVRKALGAAYPDAMVWGRNNDDCHAALLTMWLQYDHVLPHSRGGGNGLDNLVLTCAGCNYGRMAFTLEQVGLLDPRLEPWPTLEWNGLEDFLTLPRASPYVASN